MQNRNACITVMCVSYKYTFIYVGFKTELVSLDGEIGVCDLENPRSDFRQGWDFSLYRLILRHIRPHINGFSCGKSDRKSRRPPTYSEIMKE